MDAFDVDRKMAYIVVGGEKYGYDKFNIGFTKAASLGAPVLLLATRRKDQIARIERRIFLRDWLESIKRVLLNIFWGAFAFLNGIWLFFTSLLPWR